MPAPTNISFATATDLGTLPASITQVADFAGTTYNLFFSFTAPAGSTVIGAFGFGDLSVYTPTIQPYDSTHTGILAISVQNKEIQFPVTAGATYFLELVTNGGNPTPANLSLSVYVAPNVSVPVGSIAVNDDTVGFPLALISSTADYTVLRFVDNFPAGEAGDTLSSGMVLVENADTGQAQLYDQTFNLIATITVGSGVRSIRTCSRSQIFYAADGHNPPRFLTVTNTGTASGLTTLTGSTSLQSITPNLTETILYHAGVNAGDPVERWDITNGVALTNLVAGIATYKVSDMFVLADGTILVAYYKDTAVSDFKVLHYSTAGATLNTYNFGQYELSLGSPPRLASAIDDPNSFWAMQHQTSTVGTTKFLNIKISDGSTLTTRNGVLFGAGRYDAPATATPLAQFGTSPSCPFWIVRASPVSTTTYTIRRQRRWLLPSSPDNKRMTIPTLELLMRTGIGLTAGPSGSPVQGEDPQVMLRISKDGGNTWGFEQRRSAGTIGNYKDRVRWLRATGLYRNAVAEITMTDPVDVQWIAALGDPQEGSS